MALNTMLNMCEGHLRLGKFDICLNELDKITTSKLDSPDKWNVENNKMVTVFLRDIEKNCGVLEDGLIKSTSQHFVSLLNKVRSLPVSDRSVSVEITVLSNYLILQSLRCAEHLPVLVDSCIKHIRRTLLRVLKHLGHEEDSCSTSNADFECLFEVIFKRCSLPELPVNTTDIVSLCCICSVLLNVAGDISKAISCLSSCPVHLIQIDQTCGVFIIPFHLMLTSRTVCGTDWVTSVTDKVHLLMAMFMFSMPGKQEQSKLVLQNVTETHWYPYTKYMLACLEYENGNYIDALMLLGKAANTVVVDNVKLKSLHSSLIGACFSKLNKHHCAIEKYKEALTQDFSYLWPLYCLSQEYQSLGLHDAELESLNLLITALENEKQEERQCLLHRCLSPCHQQITLIQAQYLLAKRCLQLQKFDAACQKYLDLLSCLHQIDNFKAGGSSEVRLPSVVQIYQEVEYSLLHAKLYTDCITVCDRVLSCDAQSQGLSAYHSDQSQDQSMLSSQMFQNTQTFHLSGSQQRKRLRSDSGELSAPVAKEDTRSVLYKADALVHLGQLESAAICLERLEEPLSPCNIDTPSSQESDAGSEPHSKRKRLDSDGTAVPCKCPPHSGRLPLLSIKHTAAEVYNHLAVAKSQSQNHKDALRYFRISLQLHPDNETVMYNLTIVLRLVQREREGATTWIKYRHLGVGSDSFQQANILRRKKQQLRSSDTEETDQGSADLVWDSVNDHQMLKLDVECLETLIRS